MTKRAVTVGMLTVWCVVNLAVFPGLSWAHCDTMSGPVVQAARQALESGNVKRVLIWVRERDEAEITRAFRQTLGVRTLGPEAKDLADTYFF